MPKMPKKKKLTLSRYEQRLAELAEAYGIQRRPITEISQIVDLGTDLTHEDQSMVVELVTATAAHIADKFELYKVPNILTDRQILRAIQSFESVGFEFVMMLLIDLQMRGVELRDPTLISDDYHEAMAQASLTN